MAILTARHRQRTLDALCPLPPEMTETEKLKEFRREYAEMQGEAFLSKRADQLREAIWALEDKLA